MANRHRTILIAAVLSSLSAIIIAWQIRPLTQRSQNVALVNGQWFEGKAFERKSMYIVNGLFTSRKPSRIDRTIDLNNSWVVPPFADAHSHSFGTGIPGANERASRAYLDAGVFYVQSQGNLPLTDVEKASISLNTQGGIDATFSNATVTSHDSALHAFFANIILPQGIFPGYNLQTLNNVRYFEIDTAEDLHRQWPRIMAQKNDFIKTYLWLTDNAPFIGPPPLMGKHALTPEVFRSIVKQAHSDGLRVSAHIVSAGDFKVAIEGGADEIAHMPSFGTVTAEIAKMAAKKNVSVVTTMGQVGRPAALPEAMREAATAMLIGTTNNLRILVANGVPIVIGADNPADTTASEAEYLQSLGIFDNAAMLRMWGTATPMAIFQNRKIGALKEGYEASFLALGANPLTDWAATRNIQFRFKQGSLLTAVPK